ncbi:MAG: alpha/beta fold hydrolase [Halobacterium sp.]
MAPASDSVRDAAREFAVRFVEESFADAVDLFSEDGRGAVVESYPDGFQRGEMDAADALEQYWYGLYGQYGDFEGVGGVDADGSEVTVELSFADGSHPLELSFADGDIADVALPSEYSPPAYADEDAFTERDVTVDAGDVELGGVLAVPDGDGPFPGVVLVHGAGIHDPDGTAGESKILKDFAWGLASQGVATLRYEKRLRDHDVETEDYTLDTVVVDDAVAAVDELADADSVDEDGVFVAGHSQGGMAAPRVADEHGGVAGVVSLDGAADNELDEDDLSVPFIRYSIDPEGDLTEEQEEQVEAQREEFRRLAAGELDPDEEFMGKPARWFESVQEYHPAGTAADLDAPTFVAKAGRVAEDVQPEIAEFHQERLDEWQSTDLPEGSRVEFYGDVGHYFQEGYEPTTMAHLAFADNVEAYVVDDVADWVREVADA